MHMSITKFVSKGGISIQDGGYQILQTLLRRIFWQNFSVTSRQTKCGLLPNFFCQSVQCTNIDHPLVTF